MIEIGFGPGVISNHRVFPKTMVILAVSSREAPSRGNLMILRVNSGPPLMDHEVAVNLPEETTGSVTQPTRSGINCLLKRNAMRCVLFPLQFVSSAGRQLRKR